MLLRAVKVQNHGPPSVADRPSSVANTLHTKRVFSLIIYINIFHLKRYSNSFLCTYPDFVAPLLIQMKHKQSVLAELHQELHIGHRSQEMFGISPHTEKSETEKSQERENCESCPKHRCVNSREAGRMRNPTAMQIQAVVTRCRSESVRSGTLRLHQSYSASAMLGARPTFFTSSDLPR